MVIQRQSGGSFNQFRYFIITPDPFMDLEVRQILHQLWVKDKDIFTERIPSNMRIGLDADADDFVSGIRYSMPDDGGGEGTPSDEWRHNPDPDASADSRYPTAPATSSVTRHGGTTAPNRGQPLTNGLSSPISTILFGKSARLGGNLALWMIVRTGGPRALSIRSHTRSTWSDRYATISGWTVLAIRRTQAYQFRGGYGFDNGEVYAVVGTLGTATGNATYVSLGVNDFHLRLGALNVEGTKLLGSTDPAWYPGVDNLDKFYVYYFTRHCEGLEELTHGFCSSVQDAPLVIPDGDKATFVERDYIRVGTRAGARLEARSASDGAQISDTRAIKSDSK